MKFRCMIWVWFYCRDVTLFFHCFFFSFFCLANKFDLYILLVIWVLFRLYVQCFHISTYTWRSSFAPYAVIASRNHGRRYRVYRFCDLIFVFVGKRSIPASVHMRVWNHMEWVYCIRKLLYAYRERSQSSEGH